MISPNEFPRLPIDDLMGSSLLTTNTLAGEFEAHANREDACLSKEWLTNNDTQCNIAFIVLDVINGGKFSGKLFGIELTLTKEVFHLSVDFKVALEQSDDPEPPIDESLLSLKLTHKSEYLISQRAEFGWTRYKTYTSKEYIGKNQHGPIYGVKDYHLQEDIKPIEISSEHFDINENINEIVKGLASITDESLDMELKDVMSTDEHLKHAYELLLILQGADENGFDVSTVMPAAFLE